MESMRILLAVLLAASAFARADVHFGNGIKIGEVDASSAIAPIRQSSSSWEWFLLDVGARGFDCHQEIP